MTTLDEIWQRTFANDAGDEVPIAPLLPTDRRIVSIPIDLDIEWTTPTGNTLHAAVRAGHLHPRFDVREPNIRANGDLDAAIRFLSGDLPVWELLPVVQLQTDVASLSALLGLVHLWGTAYQHDPHHVDRSSAAFCEIAT